MPSKLTRTPAVVIATALACAVVLGACGSSAKKPASGHASAFLAFSQCMRSHGVTNFPDPTSGGGDISLSSSSGINPTSPTFEHAQATCTHLLPGGGPSKQKPSSATIKQATDMAACMRAHGVTGFPDPIVSSESPTDFSPANYSAIMDRGGVITAIPKSINMQSPTFESAAKTCNFAPGR